MSPDGNAPPTWLKAGTWICILIAVAVVVRRLVALAHPATSGPPELRSLDAYFSNHATLTRAHIIPAFLFVLAAPIVLFQWSGFKVAERALFVLGAIVGATAYAMTSHAVGGWLERSAVLVFNTWFLISLGTAFYCGVQGKDLSKRDWLVRAVVVLLGIATTRPVMGVFFATSRITHLAPSQFFGIAFWVGFSTNSIVVEWWLNSRRRKRLRESEGHTVPA
ncbi:hypothetical protein Acid345_1857 [Candidatus Koribacter versatilis Ellin345]|uniref:DUF2306 domain-containing protein n=1 Tax=Koribacter versatilis (strain Ellin345) TaxID=204669 RepID=Q1IQJ2_KORVE|nr:hypothetical protein [Candidatus Koribacter versatilis]ABF40858.1 hypothetical protein Acid345_1857 [Candidatus Koribacter versatilis Ellin345]